MLDLHTASLQEIFDFVCAALLKQGKPARAVSRVACLYRSPDGCKCAIGHLISDDLYTPDLEGRGIGFANSKVFRLDLNEDRLKLKLLTGLQAAHDSADSSNFREAFTTRARNTARYFGLSTEVLDHAS